MDYDPTFLVRSVYGDPVSQFPGPPRSLATNAERKSAAGSMPALRWESSGSFTSYRAITRSQPFTRRWRKDRVAASRRYAVHKWTSRWQFTASSRYSRCVLALLAAAMSNITSADTSAVARKVGDAFARSGPLPHSGGPR